MTKLIDFFLKDNSNGLDEKAKRIYNQAETIVKATINGRPYGADDIAEKLEPILIKELSEVNLLNDDLYDKLLNSVMNWNPKFAESEDLHKCASIQQILINAIPVQKQVQSGIHILQNLDKGLQEGKSMLQEKKQALSLRKDAATSKKIEILDDAIGVEEPVWATNVPKDTFNGLSVNIQKTIRRAHETNQPISKQTINQMHIDFTNLVNNKVINPIKKYNEERGFLIRIKEWISDTTKKTFGFGKLSTKGILTKVASNESTLFKMAKKKAEQSLPMLQQTGSRKKI